MEYSILLKIGYQRDTICIAYVTAWHRAGFDPRSIESTDRCTQCRWFVCALPVNMLAKDKVVLLICISYISPGMIRFPIKGGPSLECTLRAMIKLHVHHRLSREGEN